MSLPSSASADGRTLLTRNEIPSINHPSSAGTVWTLSEPATSVTVSKHGTGVSNIISVAARHGDTGEPAELVDPGGAGRPSRDNTGITANGVFSVTIPSGLTMTIEYSTDLKNQVPIATALGGSLEETDADRITASAGFYRGIVEQARLSRGPLAGGEADGTRRRPRQRDRRDFHSSTRISGVMTLAIGGPWARKGLPATNSWTIPRSLRRNAAGWRS